MSEATAVAETETLTPTQETPPPAVEETPPSASTPETPPSAEAESQETKYDPATYNLDDDPEWQAIVGGPKPSEESKPSAEGDDLPGESLEDVEARVEISRAQRYSRIMQTNDAGFKGWATQQGYSAEEATQLWQQLSPMLRAVHQDNEAHNRALFNYSVGQALPKEDAETFYSRSYRSQAEALKTVYELGKKASDAEWEGKKANGQLYTNQTLQQARDLIESRYKRMLEDAGVVQNRSSANVRGTANNRSGRLTLEEAQSLPVEQLVARRQSRR